MAANPTMAELLKLKEVSQVSVGAVDKMECKKKQLLAANKAAARLLLLGIVSTESDYTPVAKHNWNGK